MVQKYETGVHDPTGHTLKVIAEQLEVSVDYLLGMSDDPHIQIGNALLADDERAIVERYRREGWAGVLHLGADHIAKLTATGAGG